MTNPAPLSVDPEQLGLAGNQLLTSAAQLPTAPAPFMPAGTDPLSVAIIGQIPIVDGPPMTELPLVQAQSTKTAGNVVGAAEAYASTDQQLGGQIGKEMQNLPDASGSGSGGAGAMGQMMGTPMQMAGQMAQMPMQVMGALAAVPQGVMQGAQQAGQQVSQMAGQFGQGGGGGAGTAGGGIAGGVGGQGDPAAARTAIPGGERSEPQQPEDRDGAAVGRPGGERAPEAPVHGGDSQAPGRHRRPEPTDDRIDL